MGNDIILGRENEPLRKFFRGNMKKNNKKNILNFIAILVVLLFVLLPLFRGGKKEQYDIVFLGDSVIGNEGNVSVVQTVGKELGLSAFNGAFGGSSMAMSDEKDWGSLTNNQWCMARMAEAIAYRDWQNQNASMAYAEHYREYGMYMPAYFKDRMDALAKIDFSRVKVLVIEHGTNDYNGGYALDNPDDLYDISTFGGALRYSLELLQESYPDMKIVLITPIYCAFGDNLEQICHETDFGGGTLSDYMKLEKEIAAEYGVICIDAFENSGIREENSKEYLSDGLHLTDEGALLLSNYLAEELKKVCK